MKIKEKEISSLSLESKDEEDTLHLELDFVLNHMKTVWCCNNDDYYNYLMRWFAQAIIKEGYKTGVSVVLVSKQGTGKGIILQWLIDYIFNHSLILSNLTKLTDKFNGILDEKTFVWIDELQSKHKNKEVNWSELKRLITETVYELEYKHTNRQIKQSYHNFFMTTNHRDSLAVENGDRRFFILECNNEYVGKYLYFAKLKSMLNRQTAILFIKYLTQFLNVDSISLGRPPTTSIKKEMIVSSLKLPFQFLLDIKNGDYEIILPISSSDLYVNYCKWTENNQYSKLQFQKMITPYTIKKKILQRSENKRQMMIVKITYE